MTPFDITCEDLGRLNTFEAVRVFHNLLFAEAVCVSGIDASKIDVPMSATAVTTPDGGIDAEVTDAHPGEGSHGVIKEGRTSYQIKSGNVDVRNPSDAKALVAVKEVLGPRVRSCLLSEGTYVVVLFGSDRPDAEDGKSERLIRRAIDALDPNLKGRGSIEVWRQSKLCGFLASFPSICLSIKCARPTALHTMVTWESLSEMRRAAVFGPEQHEAIKGVRSSILSTPTPIRVTGDPGVGKTRLVMESLRTKEVAPLVIYAAKPSDLPLGFLRELSLPGSRYRCVLVVDECPKAAFRDIWNQLESVSDRIKLITICNEIENTDPGYKRLSVAPLELQEIAEIITSYGIPEHKASPIAKLCGGSPRVAHIVGEQMQASGSINIGSYEDIWQRYIAGRNKIGSEVYLKQLHVLEWLSLFARFGYVKPYAQEGDQIVRKISQETSMPVAVVNETIRDLRSRKILQGDRTLYITPKLLHLWLWNSWWDKQGDSFSWNVFTTVDGSGERLCDELTSWFVDMLQYARESAVVPKIVENLLGNDGPFADEEFIGTAHGSQLLRLIADINPEGALKFVEHKLQRKSVDELREFREGRRCLIDTLKRTAFETHLFGRSASQLFLLACAENEAWANNATGEFAELFSSAYAQLAPSKASPAQRFPALKTAALSDSEEAQRVAIKAMNAALHVATCKTIGMTEADMLREPEPGWAPKTYGELWDGLRRIWNLGMECLERYGEVNRRQLADTLESCAFGLIAFMGDGSEPATWLRDLYATGYADETELANTLAQKLRFSKRLSEPTRETLERLKRDIAGASYEMRIRHRVGMRIWAEEWSESGKENPEISNEFAELAKESLEHISELEDLLPWLVSKQPENGYRFGATLGEEDCNAILWPQIRAALSNASEHERGSQFCSGYLHSLYHLNRECWNNAIEELRNDDDLAQLLPAILGDEGMSDKALGMLTELFVKGKISAESLKPLGYYDGFDKVSDVTVCGLLDALVNTHNSYAASVAIEISFRVLEPSRNLPSTTLASVINQPELLADDDGTHGIIPYMWGEVANAYLDAYPDRAASIIYAVVSRLNERGTVGDEDLSSTLQRLIQCEPEETWNAIGEQLLRGGQLFALRFENDGIANALTSLAPDIILSWIGHDPDPRASLALTCLPLALYDTDGKPTATREIIAKYGALEGVREEMIMKVLSVTCIGSIAQYYENKAAELEGYYAQEDDPRVLDCLARMIKTCKEAQESERIREERLG